MSKIAEEKALEIYPDIEINWTMTDRTKERMIYADGYDQAMQDVMKHAEELQFRSDDWGYAYGCGYEKAMQDIQEQAEKSVIEKSNGEVTIEDLVAYNQGFKTGRELALQDFLEKACDYLKRNYPSIFDTYQESGYNEIEKFKEHLKL